MADNSQKLPFSASTDTRTTMRVLEHIRLMSGRAPATIDSLDDTNTILTLKFETDDTAYKLPKVKVPIHGSEYTRFPYKKGDKGFVSTADMDIGNMSSLGDQNPAQFARPFNLASLIFNPIGNAKFTPTDDKDAHVSYGRTGTVSRDEKKISKLTVHPDEDKGIKLQTGTDPDSEDHFVQACAKNGVTHKSKMKVTTDAPSHEVTGEQSVAGGQTVGGSQSVAGSSSVGGSFSAAGGIAGALQSADGGLLKILDGMGGGGVGSESLAKNAAIENIVGDGLPEFTTASAALAALGKGKFYINTTLGSPTFYSQGIMVVCVTK